MTGKLTARGAVTRARIIEGAAQEIRENGVTVTLDDIRARTRTSKGQLFHYFPDGKEQLLLAVAAHEAERVLADQQPFLGELADWQSWESWRDAVIARYRAQGQQCPLAVLMTEVGRSKPAAREITARLISDWERRVADGVERTRAAGLIAADTDASAIARTLVAGIQGGAAIMIATGSFDYLEAALDNGIEALRARRTPQS